MRVARLPRAMATENHITTVTSTTEGLAVFVLLLVAGSFLSLVAAHFVDRGVDPIRDAVSDFGAREHPWFYRIAAIWLGLAGILTAVMLGDAMYPKPTLTILALLVFAATRWAITIFPTDLEGEDETSTGRSHVVLAVAAFAAIVLAAIAFQYESLDDPFWDDISLVLGLIMIALGTSAGATAGAFIRNRAYFGLAERILYLSMFAWFSAIALVLLTG